MFDDELMTRLTVAEADAVVESVTVARKLKLPAEVGVPETVPSAASASPVGSAPGAADHA